MKKKIFVRGPVLSQSGYGEQARFALRCLRSKEDLFDIYINPINWGQTGWIWEDNEFRRWMDERIAVTSDLIAQKQFQPDMSLQITIPNEFQKVAPLNYGYTAGIETTNVSPGWLVKANEMDGMIVISEFAKTGFTDTIATAQNQETGEEMPYKLETDITLMSSDLEKNTEFRIKWPRGEMGSLPADSEQFMLIEHLANQLDDLSTQIDEGKAPYDQQQKLTLEFYEKRLNALEENLEKMRNGSH